MAPVKLPGKGLTNGVHGQWGHVGGLSRAVPQQLLRLSASTDLVVPESNCLLVTSDRLPATYLHIVDCSPTSYGTLSVEMQQAASLCISPQQAQKTWFSNLLPSRWWSFETLEMTQNPPRVDLSPPTALRSSQSKRGSLSWCTAILPILQPCHPKSNSTLTIQNPEVMLYTCASNHGWPL